MSATETTKTGDVTLATIVVRLWKDYGSDPINALVHDWEGGTFTLPMEHLLAQQVWADSHKTTYILTVLSTEELEWDISQVHHMRDALLQIVCVPRHDRLRKSLVTDEWLIDKGLVS